MKQFGLKQSVVIVVAGLVLVWLCLTFASPYLVGHRLAKVPLARLEEAQFLFAMENFKTEFGNYPAGDETIILKALAGDNAKRIRFLNLSDNTTNRLGQYIDPWKTPYRFHTTVTNIRIHSAGINKAFGDMDDISTISTNIFR
jgi:hypothetical protein